MLRTAIPPNELIHTFGYYNAIAVASNGVRVRWNNTLGFLAVEDADDLFPVLDLTASPAARPRLSTQGIYSILLTLYSISSITREYRGTPLQQPASLCGRRKQWVLKQR